MEIEEIAQALITGMEHDNGCQFVVTEKNRQLLIKGLRRMFKSGCPPFTPEDIFEISSGDQDTVKTQFSHWHGFKQVQSALAEIFDGESLPGDDYYRCLEIQRRMNDAKWVKKDGAQ
jgi:hypothetical protein